MPPPKLKTLRRKLLVLLPSEHTTRLPMYIVYVEDRQTDRQFIHLFYWFFYVLLKVVSLVL